MGLVGWLLRWVTPKPTGISVREGFLIVALSWVIMSAFGALPFVLSGFIPSYCDAFFETMSGFTTTGASILSDIEALPKSLLFWRSLTHWLGGMGVIALAVAIFPSLGIGGFQLFKAEVPGPTKDKILPRISQTSKALWGVYVLLTVAQTILLMAGGLDLFESLCTTFGTLATGGFSPRNASIAAYSSPYVHYVVIFFMFIAGANFNLHFLALRRKFRQYVVDAEFRFYLGVVLVAVSLIMATRLSQGSLFSEALVRGSLFQVVSILTTTGFITEDYEHWSLVARCLLLTLMFIGGCSSSTGGAMKNIRVYTALRSMSSEMKRLIHPRGVFPVKIGTKPVSESVLSNTMGFIGLYFLLFLFGVLAMAALGAELDTALGSVAATLGNIGPGLGTVGPVDNYGHFPDLAKWLLSFLMMAGRLEIYTVLIVLNPNFWR
jgi:trk system potassium uptake protein TrkH